MDTRLTGVDFHRVFFSDLPGYIITMKCWRNLDTTCPEEDCPMWITEENTPGVPIRGLSRGNPGICALVANTRLSVLNNFLEMMECLDDDILPDEDYLDEEPVQLKKKEKIAPSGGAKRKPKI